MRSKHGGTTSPTPDGEEESEIIFTSFKDDDHAGDTNADLGASSPAPNDWGYIYPYGSVSNGSLLDHCIIKYGSYGIYCYDSDLTISDCTISNSYYDGISCSNSSPSISGSGATMTISNNNRYGIYLSSSSPTISGCVIAENGNHGIYLASTSQPIIGSDPADLTNWNDIHDNGGYELYNDTANDIIAMPVWWGTLVQAEIEAHIYDREDNPAKGRVLFIPWDGRNESGEKAASGVYFYSIQTGSFTAIRRMVILR